MLLAGLTAAKSLLLETSTCTAVIGGAHSWSFIHYRYIMPKKKDKYDLQVKANIITLMSSNFSAFMNLF